MAVFKLLVSRWDEKVRTKPDEYVRHTQGEVFEVPDGQVERLLRIGAIGPVDEEPALPEGAADDPQDEESSDGSESDESSGEVDETPDSEQVNRPKQTAPKPVWVDYAVSRGMAREEAEALDKRELIAALD
ncbi:hypothetical protein M1M07_23690 [Rhodococcus sp. HM1]|uniref:hypothetical protein n=1 Tax=Rhodococcus sp. HM1 TaxID=2937759 RepID=UPI00200B2268|nr:hypothetical protein [Rhodococcus sp. HM1]MCK8674101.1 hypothetical protein [Rhodococcus sp. HM1]